MQRADQSSRLSWQIRKTKKLPQTQNAVEQVEVQYSLQRNQLNKYRTRKCWKTRWQLSYCIRTLYTCKKRHLFSVDKHTCSQSWMYPFLSITASMISAGLQDHSEYQISTNKPTGKTETTHKSKKTITGLESRADY